MFRTNTISAVLRGFLSQRNCMRRVVFVFVVDFWASLKQHSVFSCFRPRTLKQRGLCDSHCRRPCHCRGQHPFLRKSTAEGWQRSLDAGTAPLLFFRSYTHSNGRKILNKCTLTQRKAERPPHQVIPPRNNVLVIKSYHGGGGPAWRHEHDSISLQPRPALFWDLTARRETHASRRNFRPRN